MAEEGKRILSKTIFLKRRGLTPYKQFHVQGEAAYDYAAYVAARRKRPCLKGDYCNRTASSLPLNGRSTYCRTENNIPHSSSVEDRTVRFAFIYISLVCFV